LNLAGFIQHAVPAVALSQIQSDGQFLVRIFLLYRQFSYTSVMRKLFFLLISAGVLGGPQVLQPVKAQGATTAVIEAFANHDIVMLAEWHADKQEHEWIRQLVSTPGFADRVDDIVMEIGNSLYQKSVDRYVSGENALEAAELKLPPFYPATLEKQSQAMATSRISYPNRRKRQLHLSRMRQDRD
jgi:uncharacterized iron-regulated protein